MYKDFWYLKNTRKQKNKDQSEKEDEDKNSLGLFKPISTPAYISREVAQKYYSKKRKIQSVKQQKCDIWQMCSVRLEKTIQTIRTRQNFE